MNTTEILLLTLGVISGYCIRMLWHENSPEKEKEEEHGPIADALSQRNKLIEIRTAELICRGYSLKDATRISEEELLQEAKNTTRQLRQLGLDLS